MARNIDSSERLAERYSKVEPPRDLIAFTSEPYTMISTDRRSITTVPTQGLLTVSEPTERSHAREFNGVNFNVYPVAHEVKRRVLVGGSRALGVLRKRPSADIIVNEDVARHIPPGHIGNIYIAITDPDKMYRGLCDGLEVYSTPRFILHSCGPCPDTSVLEGVDINAL